MASSKALRRPLGVPLRSDGGILRNDLAELGEAGAKKKI